MSASGVLRGRGPWDGPSWESWGGHVMLIITSLAIVFIIVIAWFVAHEPPKEPKGRATTLAYSSVSR